MKRNRILWVSAAALLALATACGEKEESAAPNPTQDTTPSPTVRTWPQGALTGRDDCLGDTEYDYFENAYAIYYHSSVSRDSFETMLPPSFRVFKMHHPYNPDAVPPAGLYFALSDTDRVAALELLKGIPCVYDVEHMFLKPSLTSGEGWVWGATFNAEITYCTISSLSLSVQRQDSAKIMQVCDSLNLVLTNVQYWQTYMRFTLKPDHAPVNAVTAEHILTERFGHNGWVASSVGYEMEDIRAERQ